MTTMNDIEQRTRALADARDVLTAIVTGLNESIEALKRDRIKDLKVAVRRCAEQHDKLKSLIEQQPELFAKPKTVVFHGFKVGYRKGTGGLEFDDEEQVVKLIRRHFPEQFDVLVKTTAKPIKKALEQLTAAELKKVGVTVEDTGDVVFIKPTDSAVDKLVDQLLKSATEESA